MNDFVLITACDQARSNEALNLIGSLQTRSPGFKEIWLYDLGLTVFQKAQFRGIQGVRVKKVPHFTKYWRQGWSWKSWIWTHANQKKLIFLDAGTEALKDLTEICELVNKDGYFLVSQYETLESGHTIKDIIPSDYYKLLDFDKRLSDRPVVAAGIMGFNTDSDFYKQVIKPTYELVLKGYNLGWSQNEAWRNTGINQLPDPPIRDCSYFRHDQTLFNILLYKNIKKPITQPVSKFGGFKGPNDHPEQLIWNSRLNSKLDCLDSVAYAHAASLRNKINRLYQAWYGTRPRRLLYRICTKLKRVTSHA